MRGGRARLRRVGRKSYRISSSQGKYPMMNLAQDAGLGSQDLVEQLLVEETGLARLRRGDVVIRRVDPEAPLQDGGQ